METKVFRAPMAFKAGEAGEVEAIFATLNVIDHDGDVTLPGAFGEQAVLIELCNHNLSVPPVGKGVIKERSNEAVLSGAYFLDTQAGREHYTVAKNLAEAQEWSYTFQVVDAEDGVFDGQPVRLLKRLAVVGVGQVTRGAGIGTRTVAVKGAADSGLDFTEDEVRRIKALLQNEDGTGEAGVSDAEDGEDQGGKASGDAGGPGSSGVSPGVVRLQIEILELEE